MIRKLLWIGALVLAAWLLWPRPDIAHIDLGARAAAPPVFDSALSLERPPLQRPLADGPGRIDAGEFTIHPVAEFQVEARVLGRRNYRRGVESHLSPLDLALGWGPMARPEVLEQIRIRQSNRFYYWSVSAFPVARRDIERHSANMHIIPADETVAGELAGIRAGQTVRFLGYLVNVERSDGWRWRTSLTRDDTGAGACEIVLVRRVEIL